MPFSGAKKVHSLMESVDRIWENLHGSFLHVSLGWKGERVGLEGSICYSTSVKRRIRVIRRIHEGADGIHL